MSTADEARAEACQRYREYPHPAQSFLVSGFVADAEWQASRPITDEQVEAALTSWFESVTHTGAYETVAEHVKERNRPRMRAALEAARGVES